MFRQWFSNPMATPTDAEIAFRACVELNHAALRVQFLARDLARVSETLQIPGDMLDKYRDVMCRAQKLPIEIHEVVVDAMERLGNVMTREDSEIG